MATPSAVADVHATAIPLDSETEPVGLQPSLVEAPRAAATDSVILQTSHRRHPPSSQTARGPPAA